MRPPDKSSLHLLRAARDSPPAVAKFVPHRKNVLKTLEYLDTNEKTWAPRWRAKSTLVGLFVGSFAREGGNEVGGISGVSGESLGASPSDGIEPYLSPLQPTVQCPSLVLTESSYIQESEP